MSITLLSLSCKRIINDCIEKIVPQLNYFNNNKNNIKNEDSDEEENDINIIKTNNKKEEVEEQEEEEEQNEDKEDKEGSEEEEDEKKEKLIKKKKKKLKKLKSYLLIIDTETSKILSSFLSLSDLLNTGLFSIENISRNRMPFRKSGAIYMVYPTEENCEIIVRDFRKKPLYNNANIYFMEKIQENVLDILVNENLINRIKKCYDLNLSYYIYDKNIFTFGYNVGSNLHILKCPKVYREKKIMEISIKLFTVCSVLNIYPNIIFQLDSYICQYIAREIDKSLKNLYKNKKMKKRGILLITDRTIDPITPALHDYNYSSLVYDLLEDNIKPDQNKKDIYKNISIDNSKGKLDYSDPLWSCYKDLHIIEALTRIPEDFDEFESSNIGQIGNKKDMRSSSKIEFELKNISTYQTRNKLFNLHISMATEVNKKYKSKNYKDIIEHEQDILLGEDSKGNELNFDELYQTFIEIKQKIRINGQSNDIIRLLMTYLYGFNITQNQFDEMVDDLSENQKKIFSGLNLLNLKCNKKVDMKPNKRNMLELNYDKKELKDINYNVIRAKNQIVSIIEDCVKNKLNEEKFQFTEEPENIKYRSKTTRKKKLNKFEEVSLDSGNDIDDLKDINKGDLSQLLIYFNVGGLSINEISAIRNLSKNNELGFKIVLGSTGIYSSNQYLKELINLVDNQDNEDIIDEKEEGEYDEDIKEDKKPNIKKQKNDINIEISNKISNVKEEQNEGNEDEENIKLEVKEDKKENKKSKIKDKEKNSNKKDKKEKKDKKKDKKKKEKEKEKEKDKKKKTKVKLKTIKNESDDDSGKEEDEKDED